MKSQNPHGPGRIRRVTAYTLLETLIALLLVSSICGITLPLVRLAYVNLEKINELAAHQRDQIRLSSDLRHDTHRATAATVSPAGRSVTLTTAPGETIVYDWDNKRVSRRWLFSGQPERFESYAPSGEPGWLFKLLETDRLLELNKPTGQPIVFALGCSSNQPAKEVRPDDTTN